MGNRVLENVLHHIYISTETTFKQNSYDLKEKQLIVLAPSGRVEEIMSCGSGDYETPDTLYCEYLDEKSFNGVASYLEYLKFPPLRFDLPDGMPAWSKNNFSSNLITYKRRGLCSMEQNFLTDYLYRVFLKDLNNNNN